MNRHYLAEQVRKGKKDWQIDQHCNGYKTACTSAVLEYFGILRSDFRYSKTVKDVVSILRRKGYAVRSRKSSIKKRSTVGNVRKQLQNKTEPCKGYLVFVDGHVLLLNANGETIVDTDKRLRDKRKIESIYLVKR